MINTLDLSLFNFIQSIRSPFVTDFMLFFTALGDYQVVIFLSLIVLVVFWFFYKRKGFQGWLIINLGLAVGSLAQFTMKLLIGRERPLLDNPIIFEPTYSFPSGHATVGIIFSLLISYFLYKNQISYWKGWSFSLISVGLLIGISRVFLGVHWPTDVLGGWIVGIIIVVIMIKLDKFLTN